MKRLRIITLNIAHGRGITPIQGITSSRKIRVNLRKIASLLTNVDPDIVAFQEIDQKARWPWWYGLYHDVANYYMLTPRGTTGSKRL